MLVLLSYLSQGDACGSLLMNEGTKTCLAFYEGIWNVLLSAESRKMEDKLNGVNVVSDDNQLGLTVLNESGNVAQTELDVEGLGGRVLSFSISFVLGLFLESGLLVVLSLWFVLSEQLEGLLGLVLF